MTSTDIAFTIQDGELPSLALARAKTPADARLAAKYALETVDVKGFDSPVPRFMAELPWAANDEDIVGDILVGLMANPDLDDATAESQVLKAKDLLNEAVVILSVTARKSDVEDATWGAYMLLQVEREDGTVAPVSTGAAQVMVTVYRLYVAGSLPAQGVFVGLGQAKPGRSQPVGFRVESPL